MGIINPTAKFKITQAIAHEVGSRLIDIHNKIANYITSSTIIARSMFSSVIKSLHYPTSAAIDDEMLHQFKLLAPFKVFNKDELYEFFQHAALLQTPKHCALIKAGDDHSPLYIVLRGAVQTSIASANKTAKLSVLGPAALFCNIEVINSKSSSIINYMTCERAFLIKINKEEIVALQKNNLALWYKLFDLICKSFVALERAADKLDVRLNSELYNR